MSLLRLRKVWLAGLKCLDWTQSILTASESMMTKYSWSTVSIQIRAKSKNDWFAILIGLMNVPHARTSISQSVMVYCYGTKRKSYFNSSILTGCIRTTDSKILSFYAPVVIHKPAPTLVATIRNTRSGKNGLKTARQSPGASRHCSISPEALPQPHI